MGLFDFLKKKKKDVGTEVERGLPVTLEGFDSNAVVPPDRRYTREYQDFVAAQGAAAQNRGCNDAVGTAETEPCGECGKDEVSTETVEEVPREYCDVIDEAAAEAVSGEELPEDVPVEVITPEEDDIIRNE